MFIVIDHSTETPIQAAGVSQQFKTRAEAVDNIIESMRDNYEIDDDGNNGGYEIHRPSYGYENLENETLIRQALEDSSAIVVDHDDYDVRYEIFGI